MYSSQHRQQFIKFASQEAIEDRIHYTSSIYFIKIISNLSQFTSNSSQIYPNSSQIDPNLVKFISNSSKSGNLSINHSDNGKCSIEYEIGIIGSGTAIVKKLHYRQQFIKLAS